MNVQQKNHNKFEYLMITENRFPVALILTKIKKQQLSQNPAFFHVLELFFSVKNDFRHRSCLSFAIIKALTKSSLLQSTNSRSTIFYSCYVLNSTT